MHYEMIFDCPVVGRYIKSIITKREGGDKTSLSLRRYAKNNNVEIGMYSYGSCFNSGFNVGGRVSIGRYCSFGPNVRYFGANHPIKMAVMSPYFYNKEWGGFEVEDVARSTLTIGNDVWIGANVIITSGCSTIGNGAVIGAGTVVTKDVEEYAVYVGNPGHILKKRFDIDVIKVLEESRWWECTPDELYSFYNEMKDPKVFAQQISEYVRSKK